MDEEITLAELGRRMDILGQQMNWLCENLASLFGFVTQMGNSGGGIRGLMRALKESPELTINQSTDETNKVGA